MADFKYLKGGGGGWVISAPKRAKRPDQAIGAEPPCPFEAGGEESIFTLNQVRVINNKYPFAPIHEIVIHSGDHTKNFGELDYEVTEDIFKVYQLRFEEHRNSGQVYVFHNQGKMAGESLPHPHSQIAVVPNDVDLEVPPLRLILGENLKALSHFYIFCPFNSVWPDEVWVAPKRPGKIYHEATAEEIREISFIVSRLVQIFTIRHGLEFPFNLYIYPGNNWYLRLIPRLKVIGGFEVGTGVFVNTQDPSETFKFINEHFDEPDFEKIRQLHQAEYGKAA